VGFNAGFYFTSVDYGTYVPGVTPGTGTGSPDTGLDIWQSGSYTKEVPGGGEVEVGHQGAVAATHGAPIQRSASFSGLLKDYTFAGYATRASAGEFPQALTFLLADDVSLSDVLKDAYINTAEWGYDGVTGLVTANYGVVALRQASGSYAGQLAGAGDMVPQGLHLTTFTLTGASTPKVDGFKVSLSNNIGWRSPAGVLTDLESPGFILGAEKVTVEMSFRTQIADTTFAIGTTAPVSNATMAAVFTRAAKTLSISVANLAGTRRQDALPGKGGEYRQTWSCFATGAYGNVTISGT
jgi:hypothetical protein